jgi:hypothetical protein
MGDNWTRHTKGDDYRILLPFLVFSEPILMSQPVTSVILDLDQAPLTPTHRMLESPDPTLQ